MKLFEYQAQKLLADFQIPTPGGEVASSAEAAAAIIRRMPGKAVIKAQVLTGGRGKAGGIKVVSTVEEAKEATEKILGFRRCWTPRQAMRATQR